MKERERTAPETRNQRDAAENDLEEVVKELCDALHISRTEFSTALLRAASNDVFNLFLDSIEDDAEEDPG